jgi:hypothetical protein
MFADGGQRDVETSPALAETARVRLLQSIDL